MLIDERRFKKRKLSKNKEWTDSTNIYVEFFSSIVYEYNKDGEIIYEYLTLKKKNSRMENNYMMYLIWKDNKWIYNNKDYTSHKIIKNWVEFL